MKIISPHRIDLQYNSNRILVDQVSTVPILNTDQYLKGNSEMLQELVRDLILENRRLATIINAAHDAIYTRNLEGIITSWNPGSERLYGYSATEILGQSYWRLIPPECRDELEEKQNQLIHNETVDPFETRRVRKDGQIVFVSIALSAIRGENDEVIGITSIGRDITRRTLAEQALRASEERMNVILNTAADAIITLDSAGIIETVNPATSRMFGYTPEELNDQNVSLLLPAFRSDKQEDFFAYYRTTVEQHHSGSAREIEGQRKDGSTFPIDLVMTEIESLGIYKGIIRDISDRRRAELARQQLLAQLTTITEDERRRISRELHDETSQVLAALIAGIKMVRESAGISKENTHILQRLQDQADQVGQMVHRIAWELRPASLDKVGLEPALSSWVDQWSEWVRIPVKFYSTLGSQRLLPDAETQIYRLVAEALANVAKHANATRVSVLLDRRPDVVFLCVEDDGIGFDPDSINTAGLRNGLGLLGMRERAALLGGSFDIESGPHRGTAVLVRVPVHSVYS